MKAVVKEREWGPTCCTTHLLQVYMYRRLSLIGTRPSFFAKHGRARNDDTAQLIPLLHARDPLPYNMRDYIPNPNRFPDPL
jgi:hypothetical protein